MEDKGKRKLAAGARLVKNSTNRVTIMLRDEEGKIKDENYGESEVVGEFWGVMRTWHMVERERCARL